MLHFYQSNRLENLAEGLAEAVRAEGAARPATPFEKETILVLSRPMQHWLSLRLAEKFRIWANGDFPFPLRFFDRIFRDNLAVTLPDPYPFDPHVMTWKVMRHLPARLGEAAFAPIRRYLESDADGYKRYQLSCRIADLLDQYMTYRPDTVRGWVQGQWKEAEAWQAALWSDLVASSGRALNRAALAQRFLARFSREGQRPASLPARLFVFGVCALPPVHLAVLDCLSRFVDVHVFMLNPCQEYWCDIVSRRAIARRAAERRRSRPIDQDREHIETGNSLLASLGQLGREFSSLVLRSDACVEHDLFEAPAGDSRLARLQREILELRDPDPCAPQGPDRSIQLHCCHSPMREVEVLHDRLLALFDDKALGLEPRDVVVLAPDIEAYAPYVQAVFGAGQDERTRIPFAIADRSAVFASPVMQAFRALLDLPGGRFTSEQLMRILEFPPVLERFGLEERDLAAIRGWLADTRVYWGLDAAHRGRLGLPAHPDNTWRAGLDRLLLGYALPGGERDLFGGILPYDSVEGRQATALGALAEFVGALADAAAWMETPRPVLEWCEGLAGWIDRFLITDASTQEDVAALKGVLAAIEASARGAGFADPVSNKVIQATIEKELGEPMPRRFLSGGVNFSAFVPFRSIPFRVVCLLGMDDETFPREDSAVSFDLIAAQPMPGDSSRRVNDRYLFLEGILSARDVLYISYVGRSLRDNSPIQPSVLVSELLDYLTGDDERRRESWVTVHPLQPFSPRYFLPEEAKSKEDRGLFSYSAEYARAGASMAARPPAGPRRGAGPLDEPPEGFQQITIRDLIGFFRNPARFFLDRRLGVSFAERIAELQEEDEFDLSAPEQYELAETLMSLMEQGVEPERMAAIVGATGILPHGRKGRVMLDEKVAEVSGLLDRLTAVRRGRTPVHLDLEKEIAGIRIAGRVDGLFDDGLLRFRLGKLRARHQLGFWIEHLFLGACGESRPTRALGQGDDEVVFQPLSPGAAGQCLEGLVGLFKKGLREPLRFFPDTSWIYVSELRRRNDPGAARDAARKTWLGGGGPQRGEKEYEQDAPFYRIAFAGMKDVASEAGGESAEAVILDETFEELSTLVFGPMEDAKAGAEAGKQNEQKPKKQAGTGQSARGRAGRHQPG